MSRYALMRGASAAALTLACIATAQAQTPLPNITIGAAARSAVRSGPSTAAPAQVAAPTPAPAPEPEQKPTPDEKVVTQREIQPEKPRFTDTARVIAEQPGVSMYTMGGVSGLPAIRGQADERIKVIVGGVQTTSACANHMNSPLSYTDPNTISSVDIVYGVSSVSKGGDSTGGSIIVSPRAPMFATSGIPGPVSPIVTAAGAPLQPMPLLPWDAPGALRFGPNKEVLATGSLSSFFRGNNNGWGVSGVLNMATDHWSVLYNGSFQRAGNYQAGGGAGQVYSTNFQSENHAVTLGYQNEGHLVTVRGTYQNIPYQGFPNMRMDMTRNKAYSIEANYKGAFNWGTLDARVYWAQVYHKMGFLDDRSTLNHGMLNDGRDFGYSIKSEIPLTDKDLLRVGNEFHGQRLQDYWPSDLTGFPGLMTRPFNFVVINGGQRNRMGTYAEWERAWSREWSTVLGFRNDTVWMDTNNVQPYDPFSFRYGTPFARANAFASVLFNAQGHARTDANFDMTAIARYKPAEGALYEVGYSRKTRSPSLYERYVWPVAGPFMGMFNWFGDGNGYTGSLSLAPEVSHNVSVTGTWKDMSGENRWEARVSPFYSYVENYIAGGRTGGTFNFPTGITPAYIFQILQFRNYNAQLYGVDGYGKYKLFDSPDYGRLTASATVSYVYGENLDIGNPTGCLPGSGFCSVASFLWNKGDGLWNMMPLNSTITLEHQIGGLTLAAEANLVNAKNHVSANQGEFRTPGYALLNLRSSYEWSNFRIDAGVDNITDALYSLPLGGFDLTQYYRAAALYGNPAAGLLYVRQVPGMGRNFYAGLTVKF
ncbi:TonB-dependent receptor [Methylocystis sp. ATCC 49242]|uniref:TonB-dependent receptor n=1 Tax=Methylocystis sp. ATCC 49242 TaxID=622637 RepID=UPI0001F88653|nr:TonB-dependent receptor plug domain-containing protein [Methylocystis sp. ATCC 49242]